MYGPAIVKRVLFQIVLQCVAVCCSVLQCVAVRCSVLQCVAVCCSVLQCAAVCYNVLQRVAVCCSVLPCIAVATVASTYTYAWIVAVNLLNSVNTLHHTATHCNTLQHTGVDSSI